MSRLLLLTTGCIILFGCIKETTVVQVLVPPVNPPDTLLAIHRVVPSHGRMSDSVIIYGSNFDSLRWPSPVTFNGVPVDLISHTDSTIRLRVPLRASSGSIIVATRKDTVVGPNFTVDSVCAGNLCIVHYYGPLLTEQQAWQRDCRYHYVEWTAQIRGDTIELIHDYCVGDDSHFTWVLRFKWSRFQDLLPTAVDGYWIDSEILGTSTDTLKGLVAIQSWDPDGIVSGKVSWFFEIYNYWWDFVFWYDFSPGVLPDKGLPPKGGSGRASTLPVRRKRFSAEGGAAVR